MLFLEGTIEFGFDMDLESGERENLESGERENLEYDEADLQYRLDNIPRELFLHICSFLPSKFVINVLSQVCIKFKYLTEDDIMWKVRIHERFSKRYPIINHDDINWAEACMAREEQCRLWSNNVVNMRKYQVLLAHNAPVDVVHLFENGRLCASGSRDRDIKLWNLNAINEGVIDNPRTDLLQSEVTSAHSGWIWSMAYSDANHTLYSGSWDGLIKGWDIEELSLSNESSISFNVKSPVLCLAFSGDILVCGRYDRYISAFDPRVGNEPIFQHSVHRKPVLCMGANERFIISGSEDHSLVVYNRIAGKTQNTLQFEAYPFSLSFSLNNLWLGDSRGDIHLVDPYGEKYELVGDYPSGHKARITGIHHSLGSIITCSSDKTIRVLEPCPNPDPICSISMNSEVTGISAFCDILVSSNIDESISIWVPEMSGESTL